MSSPTFVVGTAGHVDHGKSSLVRALTGTDPDRLAEEQLRQMTIDLGFAEFTTPTGNRVHLVDVPGHERFVRNMLAGAGGIDAAILVIAADDGPMPQTREHLAILDLLGIERGVVALNKADLVDDEWMGFVGETVRELLIGTSLAGCEIVPVSSVTSTGLVELQTALDVALGGVHRTGAGRHARLPIDRVFSVPGFGTIVTGTLLDGQLHVGDRIEIVPSGRMSRIRGLQTFGTAVPSAAPGSRVAVNLIGLETGEVTRGDVLSLPDTIRPVMRLDTQVRMIEGSERPLRHNDDVVVFAGSAETPAKVALLDCESIEPGAEGWVQLRLARPAAVLARDRFILRRPSPAETIGGGEIFVLDPPRHKRFQAGVIERLSALTAGEPADLALAWLGGRFAGEPELRNEFPGETIFQLERDGRIQVFGGAGTRFVAASTTLEYVRDRATDAVNRHHLERPLEAGMPRELLRQLVGLTRPVFDALIDATSELEMLDTVVRRAGFTIMLNGSQHEIVTAYLDAVRRSGFQPHTPDEAGIPLELVQAMIAMGEVVSVGDGIVFTPDQIVVAETQLRRTLAQGDSISLAEYRDVLGTTRKYAQALLEYFDRQRVTRRIGDRRIVIGPATAREREQPQ